MCAMTLLQTLLTKSCDFIHQKRMATLAELSNALVRCERLTMTELGNELSLRSEVSERHSIKRVSNFLSNTSIQEENLRIQEALAHELLFRFVKIRLIVDWTPTIDRSHYTLRANLICKNSSVVIYQETYLEEKVNNTKIQNQFLKNLHKMIPKHIKKVIVITDAGFQGEWYKQVEKLGWYFCGRVRGTTQIFLYQQLIWEKARNYAEKATGHIRFLGEGLLAKSNQYKMYMYVYKQPLKPIKKESQRNNPNSRTQVKRHIRSYTDGWFIVTNLKQINKSINKIIISHYKDRMKIEASNRTTKSTKYGFGLKNSMTKKIERIKILLLIEHITSFITWLVGSYKEYTKSDRNYSNGSANGMRRLSLVKLGIRVLKRVSYLSYDKLIGIVHKFAKLEANLC